MLSTPHPLAPTVPLLLFCMYECMFASITPALISGSMAERARFRTFCLFIALWLTLVYCPVAHIIWSPDGWLYKMGILDFAGGMVVHLTSGASALVFSLFLRRRKGYYNLVDVANEVIHPPPKSKDFLVNDQPLTMWEKIKKFPSPAGSFSSHSLPLLCIGTGILWVGWFGFNGGSSLIPNAQSVIGLVNTNFAGAVSALTWMILDMFFHKGKSPIVGICNGAVCGLAAVTPAAGYLHPSYACLCGFLSTLVSYFFIKVKVWFMDDSLDVVAIHMMQGIFGTAFTGIFASKSIAALGGFTIGGGWIDGNFVQLGIQVLGIVFVFAWSFVITVILYVFLDWLPFFGWRVTPYEERIGLDQSQHGEDSYIFEDLEDLEYLPGEKEQEDFAPITKVLFKEYLVEPVLRPGKKYLHTKKERETQEKELKETKTETKNQQENKETQEHKEEKTQEHKEEKPQEQKEENNVVPQIVVETPNDSKPNEVQI